MRAAHHIASGHSPLRGLRAAAGLSLVALAGCVSNSTPAASVARSGDHSVTVEGQSFVAQITQGAPGAMLTAAGARAVSGNTLRVTRAGAALAMDEGAVAKKAARAGCQAAGGRFSEVALGRYDRAGSWVFAGGCA